MKKQILLAAALLFAVSMVFAQERECEDCSIDQIVSGPRGMDDNTSDVDQTGSYNEAYVLQEGIGNYSKIDQNGLMYSGYGNAGFGGYGNLAEVSQLGLQNHSDIDQNGNYNTGSVSQEGTRNYAKQVVGVGWAENNIATVDQVGEMNTSFQFQYNDNNEAHVTQGEGYTGLGEGNYAEQFQDSGADGVAGSYAIIDQKGQFNEAKQTQNGSNNNANVEQEGKRNTSVETQTSLAGDSVWNDSDVYQIGFDNLSCVTQDADGGNNLSDVYQWGWSNRAFVNQSTLQGNNFSYITQWGYSNTACVTQVSVTNPR